MLKPCCELIEDEWISQMESDLVAGPINRNTAVAKLFCARIRRRLPNIAGLYEVVLQHKPDAKEPANLYRYLWDRTLTLKR